MRAFLLKYKWRIVSWIVFLAVVLHFSPRQHDYYLDADVKNFKQERLVAVLIWIGVATSLLLFLVVLLKTKSLKQSGIAFACVSMTVAFVLFIFQPLFLGAALFINRQFKKETLEKVYVVNYLIEVDQVKSNFFAYDLSTKDVLIDRKLISRIYSPALKPNDTVKLQFEVGLFGIAYQREASTGE